jgi:Tfp pilus assembly protein PilO
MKGFSLKKEQGWTVLSIVAVGWILFLVAFTMFVPKPAPKSAAARTYEEMRAKRELAELEAVLAEARKEVDRLTWQGTVDEISPAVLNEVTRLAAERRVSVLALRPQREAIEGRLARLPYMLNVDGPFPQVSEFIADLETGANRVAVSLVQIASSDGASDRVSATVGLTAFRQLPETSPPPASPTRPARQAQ